MACPPPLLPPPAPPRWLRQALAAGDAETALFAAGGALALLDPLARSEDPVGQLWLADALLARALGWARPVPLLAAHLPRAAFRLEGAAWLAACSARA